MLPWRQLNENEIVGFGNRHSNNDFLWYFISYIHISAERSNKTSLISMSISIYTIHFNIHNIMYLLLFALVQPQTKLCLSFFSYYTGYHNSFSYSSNIRHQGSCLGLHSLLSFECSLPMKIDNKTVISIYNGMCQSMWLVAYKITFEINK